MAEEQKKPIEQKQEQKPAVQKQTEQKPVVQRQTGQRPVEKKVAQKLPDNYKHIVRIANVDVPGEKQIRFALTKIKGVGINLADALCTLANIKKTDKAGTMSDKEIETLNKVVSDPLNNGIPVWTMYNIKGMNFSSNDCLYITKEKYNELISYKTVNGDIIISRAGTVGKMAIVNSEHSKSIISTNLIKLSLNKEKLIPLYFVSLMDYCKGGVGRLKTGQDGTFTHMNTGVLNQLNFPIPPIELQNKFANVAKKTEQLKQSMLSQSEELDTNFNALMQEAFVEDF